MTFLTRGVIYIVKTYQYFFSPDQGVLGGIFGRGSCRFFPSCSEYMIAALSQYGLLTGVVVSLKRILRCNPFFRGGYDPVTRISNF